MKKLTAMKSITAIFILIAILTTFVACKKNNDDATTSSQLLTGATSTTPATSDVAQQGLTYILTTQQGETVPWSDTTRFEIAVADAPTTTQFNTDFTIPTSDGRIPEIPTSYIPSNTTTASSISFPVVSENVSKDSTTKNSASNTTATTTTTTKAPTTQPTTVKKIATAIKENDISYNNNTGNVVVSVDSSSWSSDFISNTQYIDVSVDGNPIGTAKCTLSSKKDADGNGTITVYLTDKQINEGSYITISIPQGFVQTRAGNQYSTAYSASVGV